MFEFWSRLWGRQGAGCSKDVAKERLRTVLVHDRASVAPQVFEKLKIDLIRAASRYMDVDESRTQVKLHRQDSAVALVANMPVLRLKHYTEQNNKAARRGDGRPGKAQGRPAPRH
ncbi:MAG TPA: cell division topological specificity factor MinE [Firmicutes bacterium]|nr:cell division topological specificity factor MinE [Bacillota bacterium]